MDFHVDPRNQPWNGAWNNGSRLESAWEHPRGGGIRPNSLNQLFSVFHFDFSRLSSRRRFRSRAEPSGGSSTIPDFFPVFFFFGKRCQPGTHTWNLPQSWGTGQPRLRRDLPAGGRILGSLRRGGGGGEGSGASQEGSGVGEFLRIPWKSPADSSARSIPVASRTGRNSRSCFCGRGIPGMFRRRSGMLRWTTEVLGCSPGPGGFWDAPAEPGDDSWDGFPGSG